MTDGTQSGSGLGRVNRGLAPAGELAMAAGLIGLDIATRLLPHIPNVTSLAASGLVAGLAFRSRWLAPIVPLAGLFLSDLVLGFYPWPVMIAVYAAMCIPGVLGMRFGRRSLPSVIGLTLASATAFFVLTNAAVWAFGGMYTPDLAGLTRCFVAALPFFANSLVGDIAWGLALLSLLLAYDWARKPQSGSCGSPALLGQG